MSDTLTFAEVDAQHVELLPARTVLSMMINTTAGKPPHGPQVDNGNNNGYNNGGNGGIGGNGGNRQGGIGVNLLNVNVLGHQTNSAGDGFGGNGGNANGGNGGGNYFDWN